MSHPWRTKVRPLILAALVFALAGCATHSAYDTARFRDREYAVKRITLNDGGLNSSQIQAIASTKPPAKFPIDISIIVTHDGSIRNEMEQLFMSKAIAKVKSSPVIDRIVPIPKFLLPAQLNFSIIQELGIRTLSEYVIVFVLDPETFFQWTRILETEFKITSAIDFIVVDAQTTAILSSDRLFSTITYTENLFKAGEREKAQEEIFSEQGEVLGRKITELFQKP
jgi:hypothetical protein